MIEEYFECVSQGGIKLNGCKWIPEGQVERIVCIVHGLGEHIECYKNLATHFCEANIAVYGIDLRGHGKSEGTTTHTPSLDHLLEDIQQLIASARRDYNEVPIVLFGNSMGGALASVFLLKRRSDEISAAIIQSPWLKLQHPPKQALSVLARLLFIFMPYWRVSTGIKAADISKDPAVQDWYNTDPLIHKSLTIQLYFSIEKAADFVVRNASMLELPLLVAHGSDDNVTKPEVSSKLAQDAGNNSTYLLWKGYEHEPHNDLNKEAVIQKYIQWIWEKCPSVVI